MTLGILGCGWVGFALGGPTTTKMVTLGRTPAFYVEIDGHPALVELDTGSFELRLSPEFVHQNGLDPSRVLLKIGDSIQESIKPVVEALQEGNAMTDRYSFHSDGIVGLDVLRRFAVGINDQDRTLSFWPQGKLDQKTAEDWVQIAGEAPESASRFYLSTKTDDDWFHISSTVNGRNLNFILDTGTAYSTLNPSIAKVLGLKKIGETKVEEIGKTETLAIVEADSLKFGDLNATFPVFNVESEESSDSDGILGTEALGDGKFLIDMPAGIMYGRRLSKPASRNPIEDRLRLAGLDLFPDSKNHLLLLVAPGSVADKAGVHSGDKLIAFGKISVAGMQKLLEGQEISGTPDLLRIGMELLAKELTVTVGTKDGKRIVLSLPSATL